MRIGKLLRGSKLSSAVLAGADLTNADLSAIDLHGAMLQGIVLTDVNLTDANLRGADLRGSRFTNTNLTNVDLRNADLSKSEFNEPTRVLSIAFDPVGNRLAFGADDGNIRIWEIGSRDCTCLPRRHARGVGRIAWSTEGEFLASRCSREVIVWIVTPDGFEPKRSQKVEMVEGIAFHNDDKHLLLGISGSPVAWQWNSASNKINASGPRVPWEMLPFSAQLKLEHVRASGEKYAVICSGKTTQAYRGSPHEFGGQFGESWTAEIFAGAFDRTLNLVVLDDLYSETDFRINKQVKDPDGKIRTLTRYKICDAVGAFFDSDNQLRVLLKVEERADYAQGTGKVPLTIQYTECVLAHDLYSHPQKHQANKQSKNIISPHIAEEDILAIDYSMPKDLVATGSSDGTVCTWDANPQSPAFGTCLAMFKPQMRCEGLNVEGARGLDAMTLAILDERGAHLDQEQLHLVLEHRLQRQTERDWRFLQSSTENDGGKQSVVLLREFRTVE